MFNGVQSNVTGGYRVMLNGVHSNVTGEYMAIFKWGAE